RPRISLPCASELPGTLAPISPPIANLLSVCACAHAANADIRRARRRTRRCCTCPSTAIRTPEDKEQLVADADVVIANAAAPRLDEIPLVIAVAKRELQNAVRRHAHFAVRARPLRVQRRAACAGDEFANTRRAREAVRRLRREPLVSVIVAVHDDVDAERKHQLPDVAKKSAVARARREARVMKVDER